MEQPHAFSLNFQGKIRNQEVKSAFLSILDDLETNQADPYLYLVALLRGLWQAQKAFSQLPSLKIQAAWTVQDILTLFRQHFALPIAGSARLPVLGLYAIYESLFDSFLVRYEGKQILPLESHTSADTKSGRFGDIDVIDEQGNPFEVVEINRKLLSTPTS